MRPVFIFGSDTASQSFLSALLGSHRRTVETPSFSASYLRSSRGNPFSVGPGAELELTFGGAGDAHPVTPATITRLVDTYATDHGKEDALVWLEQVDLSALPLLQEAFPEARFVHLVRDGRAVAAARWREAGEGRQPTRAARRWRERTLHGLEAEGELGQRSLHVSYEALLSDLEAGLKALAHFIDLPAEGFRIVPSVLQKEYGPHLYSWRTQLTRRELKDFEAIGGPLLTELGYGLEAPSSGLSTRPDIWYRAGRALLPYTQVSNTQTSSAQTSRAQVSNTHSPLTKPWHVSSHTPHAGEHIRQRP